MSIEAGPPPQPLEAAGATPLRLPEHQPSPEKGMEQFKYVQNFVRRIGRIGTADLMHAAQAQKPAEKDAALARAMQKATLREQLTDDFLTTFRAGNGSYDTFHARLPDDESTIDEVYVALLHMNGMPYEMEVVDKPVAVRQYRRTSVKDVFIVQEFDSRDERKRKRLGAFLCGRSMVPPEYMRKIDDSRQPPAQT